MDVVEDPGVKKRLIDVDAYHLMGQVGIFEPDERVELINGEIVQMAPIGSPHVSTVNILTRELVRAAGDQAIVSVQNPVRFDRYNEPEPDFALLRPRADQYAGSLPGPAEVLLLIEVAETSLPYDRGVKLKLYAAYGIREYWIVNVSAKSVSIHRDPTGEKYGSITAVPGSGKVRLTAASDIEVDLTLLFPEAINPPESPKP